MSEHDQDEGFEQLQASMRRRARASRVAMLIALCGALGFGAWAFSFTDTYQYTWRAWWAQQRATVPPAVALPDDALTQFHAKVLPAWAIASAYRDTEEQRAREVEAYQALIEALDADPGGQDIWRALRAMVVEEPDHLQARADFVFQTIKRWNTHMEASQQPWWISASLRRAMILVKTYRVLHDMRVGVGASSYRARLIARADRTNVVEAMLGHNSDVEEGGMVLIDRVQDATLDELWPALATPDAESPPIDAAHHSALWRELDQALSGPQREALRASAGLRREAMRTIDAVHARHGCGSSFTFAVGLPWSGLPADDYERMSGFVTRDAREDCPSLKAEELEALMRTSEAIRAQPGVADALAALGALLARAIVAHEIRHAADLDERGGDHAVRLSCTSCFSLNRSQRSELSAYLASFATPGSAAIALYQACSANEERYTSHAIAVQFALEQLAIGSCADAPPEDLTRRAADAQRRLFERDEPITLPSDFPLTISPFRGLR